MIDQLQQLGLPRKEALVYFSLLKIGVPSPVSLIAKKAHINRTTTYDILELLEQKGLVIGKMTRTYRMYEALPPAKLAAHFDEQSKKFANRKQQADRILPELNTYYRPNTGRPRIYFYEGEEGLIRVYEETITSTEEIRAYASDQANQEAVPWYFPQYYKRRAAKQIPIKAIFPDTPKDRERHALDTEELRQSRLVPKEVLDFTPEINFFDNKIMIADWKEKLGIIIESAEIAKVFKQTFDLAWEAAEKYHKKITGEN
ncbi:hypothetical protein HYV58_00150 [Candidatus Peregrinibacteria bacterium]|nr:hypothetical protein [Candidatus Peregrinibacteria bacterium]